MHGGDGETGASVPWAGRLRAARQPLGPLPPASPALGDGLAAGDGGTPPWLEAPDEFDDHVAAGGRVARWLLFGLAPLALAVAGVWWVVRASGPGEPDGSLIRAESGPYKVRPQAPGGKTFAGTGDSAYAVSQGETRAAALGRAAGDDGPAADARTPAAGAAGGVGVQVGAFTDPAAAEAGWAGLVQRNPVLSGVAHRVVAGPGDIGTVYRLQAVTGNAAAAGALCRALREAGQECRVEP